MIRLPLACVLSIAALSAAACDAGTPSNTDPDGGIAGAEDDAGSAGAMDDAGADDAGAIDDGGAPLGDAGSVDDGGVPPVDGGMDGSSDAGVDGGTDAGVVDVNAEVCRALDASSGPSPDYAQFEPEIPDTCGTGMQDAFEGFDRVVFLGDSVTVGTPPTPKEDFFRSRVAAGLVDALGFEAPSGTWEAANPFTGRAGDRASGDFYSCAEWGGDTGDLSPMDGQVADCFPPEERDLKTLVVMTMGGNDLKKIAKDGGDGEPVENLWLYAEETVAALREAITWMKNPENVPGGVHVVFANVYEFTDGTADVESCPATGLDGFSNWDDPSALIEIIVWLNEQFMSVAVDTDTDLIFMAEAFCGHGFRSDDPTAPCYIGEGAEEWFDLTCTHPNPRGHAAIAEMFLHVITR